MTMTIAEVVVDRLIKDMRGRRGLRQAWDEIDEEIQDEIREEWDGIVADALDKEDGNDGD